MAEESGRGEYFQSDPTSYQLTGIPCGNPSRYKNRGVIRMDTKDSVPYEDQRFGVPGKRTESEAEQQLKRMVQTQLDTSVTLQSQLKKQKSFTPAQTYKPFGMEAAGTKSLQEYRSMQERDNTVEKLRQYGFTHEEIQFKLEKQGLASKEFIVETFGFDQQRPVDMAPKRGRYGANPEMEQQRLDELQKIIDEKEKALSKPDSFSNVSVLSRHAMEVERSLHRGTEKANHFSHLVQGTSASFDKDIVEKTRDLGSRFGSSAVELPSLEQSKVQSDINSANQVKNFQGSGNITLDMPNIDRLDSTGSCVRSSDILNASDLAEAPEDSPKEIESKTSVVLPEKRKSDHSLSLPPDITPIDEEVISKNRLSLEGIREIPRFKDYEPGEPNKTLFIKNLSAKVTECDLVSLFIRYQRKDGPKVLFRLMKGRMKGQAFVTLPDITSATAAVRLINGYLLKGKPMILQYGKQKHDPEQTDKGD